MYIIESYSLAVFFCFITMLCWGSWANTQKLAGKSWRFELYYWDYVWGIVIFALILAFTLGSHGNQGRSFSSDFHQADTGSLVSAFVGGVIFNLSNILLVAAMALAGIAVAFPVGVGIALALGVIINYIAVPIGNAAILFSGVELITLAIIFDALAYKKMSQSQQKVSSKGLLLSILAGILMSVFYRFVASSMATDFANPQHGKITPYTAIVVFSIGILISNFIFNYILMKKPIEGPPLEMGDYFKGSLKAHMTGILGGIIWNIGMSLSIIASGQAGSAISYGLGQGATLIAALWGVFIWKEFKNAPVGTNKYIVAMFILYLVGLTLLIYSKNG